MPRSVPEHLRRTIVATGAIALIAAPAWSRAFAAAGGNVVRVTALASKTRTGVTTFLRAEKTFTGANDDGLPVFQARNLGEISVAELTAMVAQDGRLILTNEAGDGASSASRDSALVR